MTTAQSPVEVLRAALERIAMRRSHVYDDCACESCIACTALAEAAALAAEVPGCTYCVKTATAEARCPVCLCWGRIGKGDAAAPPPAPVPGGMPCNIALLERVIAHLERVSPFSGHARAELAGATGVFRVWLALAREAGPAPTSSTCPNCNEVEALDATRCAACGFYDWERVKKGATKSAAATPPEVVVGMKEADVSWTLNKPRGETRHIPEAPTPTLGKCGTCWGTGEHSSPTADGKPMAWVKCRACNGTGSRPPTDSQGGGK